MKRSYVSYLLCILSFVYISFAKQIIPYGLETSDRNHITQQTKLSIGSDERGQIFWK